jgi:hypothetical protein
MKDSQKYFQKKIAAIDHLINDLQIYTQKIINLEREERRFKSKLTFISEEIKRHQTLKQKTELALTIKSP